MVSLLLFLLRHILQSPLFPLLKARWNVEPFFSGNRCQFDRPPRARCDTQTTADAPFSVYLRNTVLSFSYSMNLASGNASPAGEAAIGVENSAVIRSLRALRAAEIVYCPQYAAAVTAAVAAAHELRRFRPINKTIETGMHMPFVFELRK